MTRANSCAHELPRVSGQLPSHTRATRRTKPAVSSQLGLMAIRRRISRAHSEDYTSPYGRPIPLVATWLPRRRPLRGFRRNQTERDRNRNSWRRTASQCRITGFVFFLPRFDPVPPTWSPVTASEETSPSSEETSEETLPGSEETSGETHGWAPRQQQLDGVLTFCAGEPFPRSPPRWAGPIAPVRTMYLRPLLARGLLERRHPESPRHPHQAYRAAERPARGSWPPGSRHERGGPSPGLARWEPASATRALARGASPLPG